MAKFYPSEKSVKADLYTKALVTKWTNSSSMDQPLYFTTPSVTADNKYLLFISDRDGSPNLYSIDRHTGKIASVSSAVGLLKTYVYPNGGEFGFSKVSPFLDCKRGLVYWIQDHEVWVRDVAVKSQPRFLAALPKGCVTGYTTLSPDGETLCVPCADPRAFYEKDESQHEQLRKVPQRMLTDKLITRLYFIDLITGKSWIHAQLPFWCTHVQFSPKGDGVLVCNSEGAVASSGKRSFPYWGRIWVVDKKGQFSRLFEQPKVETVNHENWTPAGETIVFHGKVRPQGLDFLKNAILRIAVRAKISSQRSVQATYSHYVEARNVIGDRCWRLDVCFPVSHAVAAGKNTVLCDTRDGHIIVCRRSCSGDFNCRVICYHGSTMSNQDSHPHPRQVVDGKSAIFGSDAGGSVNVYEVRLP